MLYKHPKTIGALIHKVTCNGEKPSKEKHIKALVFKSFAVDSSKEEICKHLLARLHKASWMTVVKSLMTFHRICQEGDPSFIKNRSKQLLVTHHNQDPCFNWVFITKYSKYLSEKSISLSLLDYQFEKNPDCLTNLSDLTETFRIISYIQSQLNGLLNCRFLPDPIHPLIQTAFSLLGKDGIVLFELLNRGLPPLLDMFWKMNKNDAQTFLSIYTLYCKEVQAMKQFCELAKDYMEVLPEFIEQENSIIERMEKYISTESNYVKINVPDKEKKSTGHRKAKSGDVYKRRHESPLKASKKPAKKRHMGSRHSVPTIREDDKEVKPMYLTEQRRALSPKNLSGVNPFENISLSLRDNPFSNPMYQSTAANSVISPDLFSPPSHTHTLHRNPFL